MPDDEIQVARDMIVCAETKAPLSKSVHLTHAKLRNAEKRPEDDEQAM